MVHIYNGIVLSHIEEPVWASWSEMDEPRACYTEWSNSEREKQVSLLTYIYGIYRNGTERPIFRAGIETKM